MSHEPLTPVRFRRFLRFEEPLVRERMGSNRIFDGFGAVWTKFSYYE